MIDIEMMRTRVIKTQDFQDPFEDVPSSEESKNQEEHLTLGQEESGLKSRRRGRAMTNS